MNAALLSIKKHLHDIPIVYILMQYGPNMEHCFCFVPGQDAVAIQSYALVRLIRDNKLVIKLLMFQELLVGSMELCENKWNSLIYEIRVQFNEPKCVDMHSRNSH